MTLSKIQTANPQRITKSESREPENGGEQKVSARPILEVSGHRKGQGQSPESPSLDTLSAAAYPSQEPPDSRLPTPEIYWPTTPKD
ncbi:hypothetical protein GCM10010914_20860 [Deinococcus wulumuqiensis]|uniref:Uncharacterized protein n=1 Tax=Deinococcus wulumuqiensis TaxID=980427 RepID=A0AAV4K582_9DEIO|nr:hypothetical protein GCM10010914_20860 [Deinococcus wulumuqiensis]GGP30955.1 hypothetical protein GCM10008021_26060 [Deinococcus wulumuqiensis]